MWDIIVTAHPKVKDCHRRRYGKIKIARGWEDSHRPVYSRQDQHAHEVAAVVTPCIRSE